MENQEVIFIGKRRRLIIEQTIGFGKVLDAIGEKYQVEILESKGNGKSKEIILIEEKEKKEG